MLLLCAALLLAALSTGSALLLGMGLLLLLLYAVDRAAVLWTTKTFSASAEIAPKTVNRGETARIRVTAGHRCPLPVPPVVLSVATAPGREPEELSIPQHRGMRSYSLSFPAMHVGAVHPGITSYVVRDPITQRQHETVLPETGDELLVLPRCFELTPLVFAPSDPGLGSVASATEDVSDPMDVRAWQRGDSMKKVHWKLSARKRELMVRRFEEPTLPEALVLLDCTPPETGGDSPEEARTVLQDTLLETAASIMNAQLHSENEVRLPLWGDHPVELSIRMGMPLVLERLARVRFDDRKPFARQLQEAAQRTRRFGAAVVITTRLDGHTTDLMVNLRRLGPTLRLYLVTETPDRADWQRLIGRLQEAGAEVISVAPAV